MGYTDAQMVIASQIAYFDMDESLLAEGGCRVRDALEHAVEENNSTGAYARHILRLMDELPGGEACGEWVIRDVRNDQHGSGMYACMLETGRNEALIAFRGSESDTKENLVKDWGMSDLGLFNNRLTAQQKAAQKYTEDLFLKYGVTYTYSTTGHSLGGNLAEHAAITIPAAMRGCFSQCVNLDGPGYSAAYLLSHALEISVMKEHIVHDQWSLVGTLLDPVPGSDYRTVEAVTPKKKNGVQSLIWRHDTLNVVFDENGNMKTGKKDLLASVVERPVRLADAYMFFLQYEKWGMLSGMNILSYFRNLRVRADMERDGRTDLIFPVDTGPSGDYEAQPDQADRMIRELEEAGEKIRERIRSLELEIWKLPFYSGTSDQLCSRIEDSCKKLEFLAKETEDFVRAGERCMKEIRNADSEVEALFTAS